MKIAVGCPVANRAWSLSAWFQHVDAAFSVVDLTPTFVFVLGDSEDDTEDVLHGLLRGRRHVVVKSKELPASGAKRDWSESRYHFMVGVRNKLLDAVQRLAPEYFLSLDSDILLHPDAVGSLLRAGQDSWAVGGKLYMTPPPSLYAPSFAKFKKDGGLLRGDAHGIMPVDVIMAMKLMTADAYHVPYEFHPFGEDIGWSKAVKAAGGILLWDGRVCSKHITEPYWLDKVDPRLGW